MRARDCAIFCQSIVKVERSFGGAVDDAAQCHAANGAHLRRLLGENHRYVFTLIHKFQSSDVLCDRRDVIVIADAGDVPSKDSAAEAELRQATDESQGAG